jgi:2-dehydropantoate 2-reductase
MRTRSRRFEKNTNRWPLRFQMNYAILGVGGVGGLVGGLLARSGQKVTFVARGSNALALRTRGLCVRSILGDFTLDGLEVVESVRELVGTHTVLVCVKGWQLPAVMQDFAAATELNGAVIPLLNGTDAVGDLCEVVGEERTIGGLCRMVSEVVEPGTIRHWGVPPTMHIGELDGRISSRLERLAQDLDAAQIAASCTTNILGALWEKTAFIASWGVFCAAAQAPVGTIRQGAGRRVLERAVEEIVSVARHEGIVLAEDLVVSTMSAIESLPASSTSSLQRDFEAKRATELEWQVGAVLRRAARAGLALPTLEALYSVLLPRDMETRGGMKVPA